MQKLIFDASIVINWAHELGDSTILELLLELGYDAVIPRRVEDEISGVGTVEETILERCKVRSCGGDVFEEVSNRYFRLGSGETAVLALGKEYQNAGVESICVVDDRQARNACENENLEFTGQIGLLNRLIEGGLLERVEATEYLRTLEEEGAWLPPDWDTLLEDG